MHHFLLYIVLWTSLKQIKRNYLAFGCVLFGVAEGKYSIAFPTESFGYTRLEYTYCLLGPISIVEKTHIKLGIKGVLLLLEPLGMVFP